MVDHAWKLFHLQSEIRKVYTKILCNFKDKFKIFSNNCQLDNNDLKNKGKRSDIFYHERPQNIFDWNDIFNSAPETRLFPSARYSHIAPQSGNQFCLS